MIALSDRARSQHIPRAKRLQVPSILAFLLGSSGFGWAVTIGVAADHPLTPALAEGPYFPSPLPSDTDNDLLIINDQITPALGEITHLSGRVMDSAGNPIANAVVEIWQVDHRGVYLHPNSMNREDRDPFFQGFGRYRTGPTGEYYFRTIRPVPHHGRTPHIHFAIKRPGKETLTTRCFIKGHVGNSKDSLWQEIYATGRHNAVTVDFVPMRDSPIGELTARFDIVLDTQPSDLNSSGSRARRWLMQ
jgi:protocatechuate 3,4-dioxygenase beta subunit